MHTRTGVRYLRFGDNYKIAGRNGALTAELDRLLGPAPAPVTAAASSPSSAKSAARIDGAIRGPAMAITLL